MPVHLDNPFLTKSTLQIGINDDIQSKCFENALQEKNKMCSYKLNGPDRIIMPTFLATFLVLRLILGQRDGTHGYTDICREMIIFLTT